MFTNQQRLEPLPLQNVPVFKGDPLEYRLFARRWKMEWRRRLRGCSSGSALKWVSGSEVEHRGTFSFYSWCTRVDLRQPASLNSQQVKSAERRRDLKDPEQHLADYHRDLSDAPQVQPVQSQRQCFCSQEELEAQSYSINPTDSESLMQRHYTPEQRNRMDNAMQRVKKRDPERSRREIEEAKKEIRETRKRRREVPQHLRFQRYIIEVTDSDLSSDVDPPVGTGAPPGVPPSGGPPTVAAMPPQMVTPEVAPGLRERLFFLLVVIFIVCVLFYFMQLLPCRNVLPAP
ncbi:uncharacterized protein LOC118299061 isoform X2 [Scophthalmus maximus]|uniref:uncharacterized protein LOC118299061 isoform X2 n=1 Tax=Scophthalmus maximus TaxID=52904 RepID=UPI001FA82557|nr:uncharacterized protein LOC118299061 isoform X2 [Scophthalmus maximus]